MQLNCQRDAIKQLQDCAQNQRHSICIEGPAGSGKTYLAQMYGHFLQIPDFMKVPADVNAVREFVDSCYRINTPVVICIENLDTGSSAAAYALLKVLEEPRENIYIVVTCESLLNIPDTIVSRSVCVTVGVPVGTDMDEFIQSLPTTIALDNPLRGSFRSFKEVKQAADLTSEQVGYIAKLSSIFNSSECISDMMWKLGHFADNKETPIQLVLSYLIRVAPDNYSRKCIMRAAASLNQSRLPAHVVLAKMLIELKYYTD